MPSLFGESQKVVIFIIENVSDSCWFFSLVGKAVGTCPSSFGSRYWTNDRVFQTVIARSKILKQDIAKCLLSMVTNRTFRDELIIVQEAAYVAGTADIKREKESGSVSGCEME